MDTEWNQLEIGEFSSDIAKASGCRSTPTGAHVLASGGCSKNLWNQAMHTALFTKLSCAIQTEELLFSRDMPILKHANRNFEPSLQILRCPCIPTGPMQPLDPGHLGSVLPKHFFSILMPER